jgi:hypothetical protein
MHQPPSYSGQSGPLDGTSDVSKFSGSFIIPGIVFFSMNHKVVSVVMGDDLRYGTGKK